MPKKKEIDTALLIKIIEDGNPQKEIMDKFGFNTSTQLKLAYINALTESGKVPAIKGGRGTVSAGGVKKEVTVNKRGSLVIPKALVEDLGFKEGETFEARKTKIGISLRKAGEATSE